MFGRERKPLPPMQAAGLVMLVGGGFLRSDLTIPRIVLIGGGGGLIGLHEQRRRKAEAEDDAAATADTDSGDAGAADQAD